MFRDVCVWRFVLWLISIVPAVDVLVSPVDRVIGCSVGVSRWCCGGRADVDDVMPIIISILLRSFNTEQIFCEWHCGSEVWWWSVWVIAWTTVSYHICLTMESVSLSGGSLPFQSFNEALDFGHDVLCLCNDVGTCCSEISMWREMFRWCYVCLVCVVCACARVLCSDSIPLPRSSTMMLYHDLSHLPLLHSTWSSTKMMIQSLTMMWSTDDEVIKRWWRWWWSWWCDYEDVMMIMRCFTRYPVEGNRRNKCTFSRDLR